MLTLQLNATGALWANDSLNFPLSSLHKHIIKVWALERAGARDLCGIERVGARDLCFMERADPGDSCCEGLSTVKCPQQYGSFRQGTGVTEVNMSSQDVAGSTLFQGNASPTVPEFQARNRRY
jgi:hypothetical protein